jgi:hypothetical protein
VYINRAPLDFDDTENLEADQGLELTDSEISGGETILDYVKYQALTSLTIFAGVVFQRTEVEETFLRLLSSQSLALLETKDGRA